MYSLIIIVLVKYFILAATPLEASRGMYNICVKISCLPKNIFRLLVGVSLLIFCDFSWVGGGTGNLPQNSYWPTHDPWKATLSRRIKQTDRDNVNLLYQQINFKKLIPGGIELLPASCFARVEGSWLEIGRSLLERLLSLLLPPVSWGAKLEPLFSLDEDWALWN